MAQTTDHPSDQEPEIREPPEAARAPEHVHLYVAPGMNTVSFAELMMTFGIRRDLSEWMDGIAAQLASLQEQVNELRGQTAVPAETATAPPQTRRS